MCGKPQRRRRVVSRKQQGAAASGARAVDRNRAEPLHAQVAADLMQRVTSGMWPVGTALPSEAGLCEQFGVARSVVRQALAQMAAAGLIQRDVGRPAVVCAPRPHRRMVQRSTGLYEQFEHIGLALQTQIVAFEPRQAPPDVATFFNTDDVLFLERVRSVGGARIAYVHTWLPRVRLPGLTAAELENASLHRVLAERFGIHPGGGRHHIRAVAADEALAKALQVGVNSPLLMLQGEGRDTDDAPLEWFTTWHHPDKLAFEVDVSRDGESLARRVESNRLPAAAGAKKRVAAQADRRQEIERIEAMAAALAQAIAKLKQGAAS
ncbi:GntR family transcriptional regulator [Achromobacter aestuarii]|nr:GntR family transcriptional regulator [Achromobacter aestuarii]